MKVSGIKHVFWSYLLAFCLIISAGLLPGVSCGMAADVNGASSKLSQAT
jgi:hypothetical protein